MKRSIIRVFVLSAAMILSGCATGIYPGGPTLSGALISNTKSTASALAFPVDPESKMNKMGESSSAAFLGLFAFGDASVTAAMESSDITKVHHVDYQNTSFLLGLFLHTTTIVYGE